MPMDSQLEAPVLKVKSGEDTKYYTECFVT
jgi:hypothetical protein